MCAYVHMYIHLHVGIGVCVCAHVHEREAYVGISGTSGLLVKSDDITGCSQGSDRYMSCASQQLAALVIEHTLYVGSLACSGVATCDTSSTSCFRGRFLGGVVGLSSSLLGFVPLPLEGLADTTPLFLSFLSKCLRSLQGSFCCSRRQFASDHACKADVCSY